MLEVIREEHPGCRRQHQLSEVLREYREYERSVTTLVDAAVKPKVGAYVTNIRTRLDEIAPGVPFYVMKSNGGVLSAGEVVHQPITTMLSGPAAGALGAALIARHRRASTGSSPATAAAPRPTSPSSSTASRRSPPRARSATTRRRSR